MFQSSSNIDNRLTKYVEQVENTAGYQVLSARLFWTPALSFSASCEVLEPRRISLLEEYVLRAADELGQVGMTGNELADLLGVDERFISHTIKDLLQIRAVSYNTNTPLMITDAGRTFYKNGQVPQQPKAVDVELICLLPPNVLFIPKNKRRAYLPEEADEIPCLPGMEELDDSIVETVLDSCDETKIIETTAHSGRAIHDPSEGRFLRRILSRNFKERIRLYWAILVVRDVFDERLFVQVQSWSRIGVLPDQVSLLENQINTQLGEGKIKLLDLMLIEKEYFDELLRITSELTKDNISDENNRAIAVERVVQSELLDIRTGLPDNPQNHNHPNGTAELVRDGEIRPTFLNALEQARKRVLIVSPWITEQAVDDELIDIFSSLASKRVITVLGWGIARSQDAEEKQPAARLLARLGTITTPEGLPAVIVVWLGNQHSKDVIVDDQAHLCGSHNWLSYRGDYQPRGESVYRVTIPEQVLNASHIITDLFIKQIDREWEASTGTANGDREKAYLSLIAAWIGLGQLRTAAIHATDIAMKQGLVLPLATLCHAASERLIGATPDTRLEILEILGNAWPTRVSSIDASLLRKSVRHLIERLIDKDRDKLAALLEQSAGSWKEIGVLHSEDAVVDPRNWTDSSTD